MTVDVGLCQCGCGERTLLAKRRVNGRGLVKGQPQRFLAGHGTRKEQHPNWIGGFFFDGKGYVLVRNPIHPRAHAIGYVYEHILVAEHALGYPLPPQVEIHHVNEVRHENQGSNLVICENHAYHMLLHGRMKALREGGNASAVRCIHCRQWDLPSNGAIYTTHKKGSNRIGRSYHRACNAEYERARRESLL